MSFELDHFFVFTKPGAPEIEQLLTLGLTEGTSNTHPGQGTANRRIFFHNAMLEFLWVCNEQEIHDPVIEPMQFGARSRYHQTGFSPFGIGLRSASTTNSSSCSLPVDTWQYCPPYLPNSLHFEIVSTHSVEPLIFLIPFSQTRPDRLPLDSRQPINHLNPLLEITNINIVLPSVESCSQAIQVFEQSNFLSLMSGKEHLADIEFDYQIQKQMVDFRPSLPLRFFY
ncbi:MAG: hypothetical protein ABEI32_15275 [Halothece sp.]